MCFSETASFSAAGVLAVMSFFSLKGASRHSRYLPLALIPLFFAVQQFSEGLQWHFFKADQTLIPSMSASKYVFTFFAYAWWPFWIPLSLLVAEDAPLRKIFLSAFAVLGFLYGAYILHHFAYTPVKAVAMENSIQYTAGLPYEVFWPYLILTIVPWFVSSLRGAAILGTLFFLTAAVASYYYYNAFVSVWCFLGALVSALVIVILNNQKKVSTLSS
jgi:hypothetical protein